MLLGYSQVSALFLWLNTVTCPGDVICSSLHVLLVVMLLCVPFGQYIFPRIIGIPFVVSLGSSIYSKMYDTVICFALSGHSQVSVLYNG